MGVSWVRWKVSPETFTTPPEGIAMPLFYSIPQAAERLRVAPDTLRKIVFDYQIGKKLYGGRWKLTDEEIDRVRAACQARVHATDPLPLRPRAARTDRLKKLRIPWHQRRRGTADKPVRQPWKCTTCGETVKGLATRCPFCRKKLLAPDEVARRLCTLTKRVIEMAEAGIIGRKVKIFRDDKARRWWRFTAEEIEEFKKDFYSAKVRSNP